MSSDEFTVTLTRREMVALHRAAAFFASAFEDAGVDLTHVQLPDGETGVSPMVAAVAKLEVVLMVNEVEL